MSIKILRAVNGPEDEAIIHYLFFSSSNNYTRVKNLCILIQRGEAPEENVI
jgi:hypothetical protein